MRSKSLARQLPGFAPSLVLAQNRDDLSAVNVPRFIVSPSNRAGLLLSRCSEVLLRLPDRGGGLDIDDDRVVDIDQIVGRIGEEGLPAMRACPARGRVRWRPRF